MFFILLGVVLFAALSFVIARGMRSQSTKALTRQQATLAASDIIDFAQDVERGINKILSNGISENQISFENSATTISTYANANCTTDNCKVFMPDGGGVSWRNPPQDAANMNWHFTASHKIPGYGGTGHAGIVLHLPQVNKSVCEQINKQLGHNFSSIPTFSGTNTFPVFDGTFPTGESVTCGGSCANMQSACIQFTGTYNIGGTNYGTSYVFYSGVYVIPD